MSSTVQPGNNGLSAQNASSDSAERHLLGCLLSDGAALLDVAPLLQPEYFRLPCHASAYRAMLSLWERGLPVDIVSVCEEMIARGTWQDFGRQDALVVMRDLVATGGRAVYYAGVVKEAHFSRELLRVGTQIVEERLDPIGPFREAQENAERAVMALGSADQNLSLTTLEDALAEASDQIDARSLSPDATGLPTGLLDLDHLLAGGLRDGELVVVAARPSVGKTSFALWCFYQFILQSRRVHFASLEQSRLELAERLFAADTGINSQMIRQSHRLTAAHAELISESRRSLSRVLSWIDDAVPQSCLRIAANARRLKARHGLDALLIDYLQLIDPEDRRAPRHEQVGSISRRLKLMARELNIPVVAMAQLNREVEGRQDRRPRLSDLRESGGIEADADTVLLLHVNDKEPALLEVIVAKQRNGPVGEFKLVYHRECMRFENFAEEPL